MSPPITLRQPEVAERPAQAFTPVVSLRTGFRLGPICVTLQGSHMCLFHGLLLNKPVSFPLGEPTSRQVGVTPVLPYVVQPYRASPYVLLHITPAGKDVASAAFLSGERVRFPSVIQ